MQFRRSILFSIAVVLVGVNAAPTPQRNGNVNINGNVGAGLTTDTTAATTAATTDSATADTTTQQQTVQTTEQTSIVTSVIQTTSQAQNTGTLGEAVTNAAPPTTSTSQHDFVTPTTTSPTVALFTASSASVATQIVQTTSQQQITTPKTTSPTPVTTNLPTITSTIDPSTKAATQPTYAATTSSSSATTSATSNAQNSGTTTSSSSNTKTILIVGGTVGGFVILAFIAFSIFRKLKLKPSQEFNSRMDPSTGGHLEEWNDPRTFRGYMQNTSSGASLTRSNSNASSKYSFDASDEKAGSSGAPPIMRGGTIRHFGVQEKPPYPPMQSDDGLREGGRGYRGF